MGSGRASVHRTCPRCRCPGGLQDHVTEDLGDAGSTPVSPPPRGLVVHRHDLCLIRVSRGRPAASRTSLPPPCGGGRRVDGGPTGVEPEHGQPSPLSGEEAFSEQQREAMRRRRELAAPAAVVPALVAGGLYGTDGANLYL